MPFPIAAMVSGKCQRNIERSGHDVLDFMLMKMYLSILGQRGPEYHLNYRRAHL